jgi:hypothetical protein
MAVVKIYRNQNVQQDIILVVCIQKGLWDNGTNIKHQMQTL